jgi:L-aminopeptidase/D-esterase-like protein
MPQNQYPSPEWQSGTGGLNPRGSISFVPGVKVGHFTHTKRSTGCSVILFEDGAAVGCDPDGSAPGSYQAELLQPVSCVQDIWGVVLSGGSSFGIHTNLGVVQYLEERKIGMKVRGGVMPIVAGGIIMDLNVGGDMTIRPDAEGAYQACQKATSGPIAEGTVGGGAGGTVGKMMRQGGGGGMKGGFGTASMRVGDVIIGAAMVLNGVGDIVDWRTGKIIAGARRADGKGFLQITEVLGLPPHHELLADMEFYDPVMGSTTIGCLATNADFNKTEMMKIAMMANCGAARASNPYHTPGDGDILYAASTHKVKSNLSVSTMGALAAQVVGEAVLQGAKMATTVDQWLSYRDYTLKLPQ